MRNLQNVISDYLSKPTDFAVQIVGRWGYGKTYYYRKILEPLIFNTPIVSNASKNFKPVYVSLFGLKSVDDVATKIVIEFYQSKYFKKYFSRWSGQKKLNITQSILKIGLRGFLNFKRLGNINEYITDIKNIGKNVLDTKELIICFDDLERKDTTFKFEDLTGYINSLVDEGIKVIIIANDDLLVNDGDTYKNLKEKIIGISVEYVPNVKETLESIIKEKYSSFPVYAKYLNENIDDLISLSKATNNNFRHIIYSLDNLHNCYSIIKDKILDCSHEISETLKIELQNISYLTIALAIEYKSSNLKFSELKNYSHEQISLQELFALGTQTKITKVDKDKFDLFIEKYNIQKENYRLYDSIFNYVTAFDEFNIDDFIIEFKKIFKLDNGKVVLEYQILNSLSYTTCFDFTDEEYREKTMQIIEFAKNGKYQPSEYLSVMHYCERLNNVLGFNLEEVKDKLVGGLKKLIASLPVKEDISFSQFEMSGRTSDISTINKLLYDAGMVEIKLFRERIIKYKIESTVELLINDIVKFENLYRTDESFNNNLSYYSFLNFLNIEEFVEKLKTSDSQTIFFLQDLFKERYKSITKFRDEFENFKKFTKLIMNYRDTLDENNKIRKYVVSSFIKVLNELIMKGDHISTEKILEV